MLVAVRARYASQPLTRHVLSPVSGYKCHGFGRQRQQPIWDHRGVRTARPNATVGTVHRHLDIWIAPRLARSRRLSEVTPRGRGIAARILSDNHLTPVAALSGAPPLALARLGTGAAPAARYHDSSAVYSCRSPVGHFDQFPPTSPSVGCRFGQRTFAGATRNGRDAPLPDLPALATD